MAFIIALVLLGVFTTNVVLGASGNAFFGNVVEMLVLFAAAISFSVAILRAEAREKASKDQ
jgi:hypothetical protein